ncbi:MAG: ABC transporter substrate-binding protein [Dehalococcoidia bacterium]
MFQKSVLRHKIAALFLTLALILPMLAACEGDDGETPASAAASVSTKPVKIGAVTSWSGPSGPAGLLADQIMAMVKTQVEEKGGILGGRSVEFLKYDDRGQVADVIGAWQKLVLEENVSAIVFGGGTTATITASSDAAEQFKVPLFNFAPLPGDLSDRPYTVRCSYSKSALNGQVHDFLLNELKPKTIALLCEEEQTMRTFIEPFKKQMNSAGVEIVYEQYVPFGTNYFSPYLTRIKYVNPDVLIGYFSQINYYAMIFKQIMDLGGWGNIKFVSPTAASGNPLITKLPGAEGTYHWVLWTPGLSYPEAQKFERDFVERYGRLPMPQHIFFYLALRGAINAIDLAGSDDPQEIAKAARSGDLHWDTPAGPLTVQPDGETDLKGYITVVKGGEFIPLVSR